MGENMKRAMILTSLLVVFLLVLSPVSHGGNLEEWYDGIEKDKLGHSFDEEFWTAQISNTTENGDEVLFDISYINRNDMQAFLVALHSVTNEENGTGTLPYQLFGMHFVTESGEEVFISALFAFLLAYEDTNGNDIPDPASEKMFHVIPFGAGKNSENTSYPPKVSAIVAEKVSADHYRFGMKYENLYAIVTENYFGFHIFKTGYIAKFAELSITYDITINENTGEVTAETYYDIGRVTELWGFILGIPIKLAPEDIPSNFGLSAVHYVTVFTSKYSVKGSDSGNSINTGVTKPINENITIDVGGDRAFEIGFRGNFSLYDKDGNLMKKDEPAVNILLKARPLDIGLVLWQLGFSAGVFSFMAYSLSDYIQENYDNPKDLMEQSLNPFNEKGFRASALWYVVCFPKWEGYRIEHDPVYTAYASPTAVPKPPESDDGGLCGNTIVMMSVVLVAPAVVVIRRKK